MATDVGLPLPYTAIVSSSSPQLPQQPSNALTSSIFFSLFQRDTSNQPAPPYYYIPPAALLIKTHITILRLLVLSALLFALIPVIALLAALVPPPAPTILVVVCACTVFPAAITALTMAVRRMREEEERVRWAGEQVEMDPRRLRLPDYADAEPLPAYEPKVETAEETRLLT
ncbi:hypothetical protein SpCBS45565_g02169 [Spizellomyces sp. 'palustris']|nr:hypothetical protein SpCBS45565_g02169 [Spizellomyces sp. 'palustris']